MTDMAILLSINRNFVILILPILRRRIQQ